MSSDPWMSLDILPVGGVGCITDNVVVRLTALASHSYTFPTLRKYILSTYSVSGTVLGTGDSAVHRKDLVPALWNLLSNWEIYNGQVDK